MISMGEIMILFILYLNGKMWYVKDFFLKIVGVESNMLIVLLKFGY